MSDFWKTPEVAEVMIELLGNRMALYIPQLFAHDVNARPIPLQNNNGRGVSGGQSTLVRDHRRPTVAASCIGRFNKV